MADWITARTTLARRHSAYFVLGTGTLATAIGVNLVVFTIINALWLRPLPFSHVDRLVTITSHVFVSLEARPLNLFEAVAGQAVIDDKGFGRIPISFDGVGRDLETVGVTPEYFRLLGIVCRGRDFTADDNRIGAEPVAIVSDRLWSQQFGRRHDIFAAVIRARPFPLRIIGVAPPGFEGARRGERVDVWIPSNLVPRILPGAVSPGRVPLMVFARMPTGQTAAEVTERVRRMLASDQHYSHFTLVPLGDIFGTPGSLSIVIREGGALAVVTGLAMLVLFGGCATLAALVLVHYESRRQELAVRIALGCSRRRLVAELCRELVLLAAAGTIAAVLVALCGLRVLSSLSLPGGLDLGRLDLSIDWRVLCAAVFGAVLTLVSAACLPITRFTRGGLAGELLAGSLATPTVSSHRTRQTLLSLHVCVTIIVLVASGLFVRAVVRASWIGPGFDIDHTLFVKVRVIPQLEDLGTFEEWRRATLERTTRVMEALRQMPVVSHVAYGDCPIGLRASSELGLRVVETIHGRREVLLGVLAGSPDLLSALRVPILAGRHLAVTDTSTTLTPAIVTESLARVLWRAENPLGQTLALRGRMGGRFLVVGIAQDFIFGSFNRPATAAVVTCERSVEMEAQFIVETAYTQGINERVRKVVTGILPDMPPPTISTGREIVMRDIGRQRLGAWFFSGFGLTALLLGVTGVFGLVAYLAESRQREFGVRVALGATPRDVVWRGVTAALVPVSLGVAAGLAFAALVSRLFTSLLIGLATLDVFTYIAVATIMLGCAACAALGAAWRLRRVAPADALRTI